MSLELTTHICGTVLIVDCTGRITANPSSSHAQGRLWGTPDRS
jgi:hypothetical protein